MSDKPRHQSGYGGPGTEIVRAACLTMAVTLGSHLDDLVVVGGLVPSLLIDARLEASDLETERHVGTMDLDIGLKLALLDGRRYAEISERLRAEGFRCDENDRGNATPQRWQRQGLKVDFLIPPSVDPAQHARIKHLEHDFAAVVVPGLELAFVDVYRAELTGPTLTGETVTRTVNVCGSAAYVVLKANALHLRGEPKDAYDLCYVVRRAPEGIPAIGARLRELAALDPASVTIAVDRLRSDFESLDALGPQRAADFVITDAEERDSILADSFGLVADLLDAFDAN